MSDKGERVLAEALELPPIERAELIEDLLRSFEFPGRTEIDELWAKEAEDRIDAYEKGHISTTSAVEVFENISKKNLR